MLSLSGKSIHFESKNFDRPTQALTRRMWWVRVWKPILKTQAIAPDTERTISQTKIWFALIKKG